MEKNIDIYNKKENCNVKAKMFYTDEKEINKLIKETEETMNENTEIDLDDFNDDKFQCKCPKCGFVLLDKLEQMDLNTLNEFGKWLEHEGLQAIATRVSTGDECSIIIEDGMVKDNYTKITESKIENKKTDSNGFNWNGASTWK